MGSVVGSFFGVRQVWAAEEKARLTLLHRELIRLTWLSGAGVCLADVQDILDRSLHLAGGVSYALLIDVREINSISIGARQILARETTILACALVGASPMDRVLAASVEHAVHPVALFDELPNALAWLSRHLTSA